MKCSILYCQSCKKYTLKETCSCGEKTRTTRPAKFSVEDKWGQWRREYKRQEKNETLLRLAKDL